MRHDEPIRRRPDGSIDTAFYCALGRRERAKQARRIASAAAAARDAWSRSRRKTSRADS